MLAFNSVDCAIAVDSNSICGKGEGDEQAQQSGDDKPLDQCVREFGCDVHKYNEKYASQELSLLYQIHRLGGGGCDLVIDIGAGNANLSCLIALVFDVPVICVEMES